MSNFPQVLKNAIESEIKSMPFASLQKAREDLGQRYREKDKKQALMQSQERFIFSKAHRIAYASTRMPATFAVVRRVLEEVKNCLPEVVFESLLDLGSGPGTALWAAADVFPDMGKATLIEQDPELIALGKRLASQSEQPLIKAAEWHVGDLNSPLKEEQYDLVILSYVIGELAEDIRKKLIETSWKLARKAVIFIEPGTSEGFSYILACREYLIASDAHLIAPCPHNKACPMAQKGDWCHFSQRLERSSEHRKLKEGSLGYEDEKYSYIVGSKIPGATYRGRILRHPMKHSGHVNFLLCTENGLKQETISRKFGEVYKEAKKLEWGDKIKDIQLKPEEQY